MAETISGSVQGHARGSVASGSRKRVSLTNVRRDASVELDDETSASDYSDQSDGSDDEEPQARPEKRARGSTMSSDSEQPNDPKFTALKSETRQVEAEIIKNKWKPTTAAAQAKVRTLLGLVERPVINSNHDPERRKEAQSSLAALSRIIETRLPRMPFPPETKEWHFDYEAILRSNRDLEQQLAAAKHSTALAQAEITKEQRSLEDAEKELKELKANARAAQSERQQRERGMQQIWTEDEEARSDDADHIGLPDRMTHSAQATDLDDADFPFIEELESHLDNFEDNVGQLAGLGDSIDRTSAALASSMRAG